MAKQNTAQSGLIGASAALAQSQIPGDYATEFMKTFGVATATFEAKRKAQQEEISEWLGKLTTDIDFTALPLQMQTAAKDQFVAYKNEVAELANIVAKASNKGSIEVKNATDRMNEIFREAEIMTAETKAYNQDKLNIAIGIDKNEYSINQDLQLYKDIYGYQDSGSADAKYVGGHLVFNVNGEEVRYNNVIAPMVKSELPDYINEKGTSYNARTAELTPQDIAKERQDLYERFKDDEAFGGYLLDAEPETRLTTISEAYVQAKENGNLKDVIEDLKTQAIDMIVQGYQDAALEGANAYQQQLADQANARRVANSGKYSASGYNNYQLLYIARIENMGNKPLIAGQTPAYFELKPYSGYYAYNPSTSMFIRVDSKGNIIFNTVQKEGGTIESGNVPSEMISIEEYANASGISVKDIKMALGLQNK